MGSKLNRTRPAQKETRGEKNEGRLGQCPNFLQITTVFKEKRVEQVDLAHF